MTAELSRWERVGTHEGRGVYVDQHGWRVEHRKQRGGPLGCQTRAHRDPAHWVLIDPTGQRRIDTSATLAGIKRAAETRRRLDQLSTNPEPMEARA